LRLQAFAVTEPRRWLETTRLQTRAIRRGDKYVVNGQKIFISRAKQSDLDAAVARTTPYEELKGKTQGFRFSSSTCATSKASSTSSRSI